MSHPPPVQLPTQLDDALQMVSQLPDPQDVSQLAKLLHLVVQLVPQATLQCVCTLLPTALAQVRSQPLAQSMLQLAPTQPGPPTQAFALQSRVQVEFSGQSTGHGELLV